MKFLKYDILHQEVPNEISLSFYIVGCALRCKGCHSTELWDTSPLGEILSNEIFIRLLTKYQGFCSCLLFLGGEWASPRLIELLKIAQEHGYRTALYSGETLLPDTLLQNLDYVKLGPWMADRGGLSSKNTNQEFWDLKKNIKLNHLFQLTT